MRDAIEAAGVDLKPRRPFGVMGVTSDAANGAKALGRQFAFLVGVAALTVTCDMHAVNKAEENAWLRAFGERGDMNDMNLLQLCFKGYWLFKERWDFYSAAWNRFFAARAIVLKKPQKPILTRWSYITEHLRWLCGHYDDLKLFAEHMHNILPTTDGHRAIWLQYRTWLQKRELEIQAHLTLEWGTNFTSKEMAWSASANVELDLPVYHRTQDMPARSVERDIALRKMLAIPTGSDVMPKVAHLRPIFPNTFKHFEAMDLQSAERVTLLERLLTFMESFIGATRETLAENGLQRWTSNECMWGALTDKTLQPHFARWLYQNVIYDDDDDGEDGENGLFASPLESTELVQEMKDSYWTDALAKQMRAQWLQWKLAGDLDYDMYEAFAGDLQVMGGGTFINIAKDVNAFRQLYRLVLFAIQHQNQLIENVFNKWDNCALKKCGMRAEQMQQNVLYVVNELSVDHAERRAKHEPLKLKGPRGRAAAGGADGKTRRRDRVVQTAASVSLAAKLVADRCRRVYQDVARVSPTEGIKSTEETLCDKYDADVAASNKRKHPDGPVDFEKLAQAAGSVSAVGGSITSVKLSKLSIEFVRGIMERFSLAGMESVSQMKELKKSGALTDAKLRERLEDELRKLFSSTEESDRKLFDQLKSELQTERTRDKNVGKKKAKSAD